jgi:hypothetical protein
MYDDDVRLVFVPYGKVNDVIRNRNKHGLDTGDRRLLIILSSHIPARVFMEPYLAYVKYRGQPLCCFHCNWWGHSNRSCSLIPEHRIS